MRLIKIVIPSLLLAACVFGTSQNAKFYTQSAMVTEAISAPYTLTVGINRIQLPKYMDRPQMVTQRNNSAEINISEFNRWVESPSVLATRAIVENLSILFPSAQIKTNQSKGEPFDRIVFVEIIKMNAILGNEAELVAWVTVKDNSKKIITQIKFSSTVPIGKTYDDLAQGYSKLLAELSQNIADILIKK